MIKKNVCHVFGFFEMKREPLRRLGTPLLCAGEGLQEAPGPDLGRTWAAAGRQVAPGRQSIAGPFSRA